MRPVARRLAQLEQRRATDQRNALIAVAALCAQGDPRTSPDFARLSPEWQQRIAWLYDVWRHNPDAFVEGIADPKFAPEPPRPLSPLFPDEEESESCDAITTAG